MEIEWNTTFETGNEEIDLQHHYFVGLINRIHNNFKHSTDKDHQQRLLTELLKYADFHFTSEENIAFSLNSPELTTHNQRHAELLEETKKHALELQQGEITIDQFVMYLYQWFSGHTIHEDRKLLFP